MPVIHQLLHKPGFLNSDINALAIDFLFNLCSQLPERKIDILKQTILGLATMPGNDGRNFIPKFLLMLATKKDLIKDYFALLESLNTADCMELHLINHLLLNLKGANEANPAIEETIPNLQLKC